jgi:hypothetical protein
MKKTFLSIVFLLFVIVTHSQVPGWVKNPPIDDDFYTGIGISSMSEPDYHSIATRKALSLIAEQIQVTIKSSNELNILETEEGYYEDFSQNVQTETALTLKGYEQVDSWDDGNTYYVYYRLSKALFREQMEKLYDDALMFSASRRKMADQYLWNGETDQAIQALLDASRQLEPLTGNTFIPGKHTDVLDAWNETRARIIDLLYCFQLVPEKEEYRLSRAGIYDEVILVITKLNCDTLVTNLSRVPVNFSLNNNLNAFARKTSFSDRNGIATNNIISIYNEQPSYKVRCTINFNQYLQRFGDYKILEYKEFDDLFSVCTIPVEIEKVSVNIESDELEFGITNQKGIVRNHIATFLTDNHIGLSAEKDESDYFLKISANTSKGPVYEDVYVSYLSVSYDLIYPETGRLIKSVDLNMIKGVGLSYETASKKAYENAGDALQSSLRWRLLPSLK